MAVPSLCKLNLRNRVKTSFATTFSSVSPSAFNSAKRTSFLLTPTKKERYLNIFTSELHYRNKVNSLNVNLKHVRCHTSCYSKVTVLRAFTNVFPRWNFLLIIRFTLRRNRSLILREKHSTIIPGKCTALYSIRSLLLATLFSLFTNSPQEKDPWSVEMITVYIYSLFTIVPCVTFIARIAIAVSKLHELCDNRRKLFAVNAAGIIDLDCNAVCVH